MTALLRRRVLIFCTLLLVLLGVIGWAAMQASSELGTLRRRFTTAEFESFRIASTLQSRALELNSALLAYVRTGKEGEWLRFESESSALNEWIDRQRPVLRTTGERQVLSEIDAEYDRYLAVARALRTASTIESRSTESPVPKLNSAAERMFSLAGKLAEAHRLALGDLLTDSQHSLGRLEALLGAALLGVLVSGGWGVRIVYRDSIMPLRRQVLEARALAERHEKMASLGVLAAGVAHEIRNPLTAIKTRLFTLDRRLSAAGPEREDVSVIEGEIIRLEHIVNDFLLFARPGEPELQAMDAGELFRELALLLVPELALHGVELRIDPVADGISFRADGAQLKQVLINLIRNGAESIEGHGRIDLRARFERESIAATAAQNVILEVSDTGSGIPPAVQERLFDPFFTTKATGTGLGLSIAMRIVEKHGGALRLETMQGSGSTFSIRLPLS